MWSNKVRLVACLLAPGCVAGGPACLLSIFPEHMLALFIWLIIRLIQLVFSAETVFFSHKKSANSVFQSAYNSSRTAPLILLF
jgi:hypothetical protein